MKTIIKFNSKTLSFPLFRYQPYYSNTCKEGYRDCRELEEFYGLDIWNILERVIVLPRSIGMIKPEKIGW